MTWRPGSIDEAVARWSLVPDGAEHATASSRLLPVLHRGRPTMLKVPRVEEEAIGGLVLAAWDASGAATVFEVDEQAIVLERAIGGRDLPTLSRSGDDLGAVTVLCSVLRTLHASSASASERVTDRVPTLRRWFQELLAHSDPDHPPLVDDTASARFLARGRRTALRLLDATAPADAVLLHGDLHHENVLEFGPGDWRAIDPKGIVGHRAFDATALFSNPDAETAIDPARFAKRVELVARLMDLPRVVLLDWLVARSALSAVWSLQDDDRTGAETVIAVGLLAEQAVTEQARGT